jgi:hypothetical protein
MRFTTRAGRRLAVGIGLASAAVLLPTAALAASAGPSAAAHPAVARCHSANTRIWIGQPGDGALGHSYFQLEFSNIGKSACTLYGYPGVSAYDVHGHQVGLPATHGGARFLVTLAPGDTAHVVLAATDGGVVCLHPINTVLLKVYPPGQFNSQLVPFQWQGCPHRSTLFVDAMHPRAGIPAYSIH